MLSWRSSSNIRFFSCADKGSLEIMREAVARCKTSDLLHRI
jgi:hypothetical protein